MTREAAAAVMAERAEIAALCDLREEMWLKDSVSYRDGRFNMAEGAGRIAAAIRARPAPVVEPAGDGWQPIATAPHMVTVTLFAVTERDEPGRVTNWRMATGYYNKMTASWNWEGRDLEEWDIRPTHWRPLPAPPDLADLQRAEGEST